MVWSSYSSSFSSWIAACRKIPYSRSNSRRRLFRIRYWCMSAYRFRNIVWFGSMYVLWYEGFRNQYSGSMKLCSKEIKVEWWNPEEVTVTPFQLCNNVVMSSTQFDDLWKWLFWVHGINWYGTELSLEWIAGVPLRVYTVYVPAYVECNTVHSAEAALSGFARFHVRTIVWCTAWITKTPYRRVTPGSLVSRDNSLNKQHHWTWLFCSKCNFRYTIRLNVKCNANFLCIMPDLDTQLRNGVPNMN